MPTARVTATAVLVAVAGADSAAAMAFLSPAASGGALINRSSTCPSSHSPDCDCSWTHGGAMCGGKDDGSECFCRCCCEHKNAGFQCRWKGGPPPPPSPPPPPPPLPPPPPPQPCTTDQQLTIKEYGQSTQIWVKSAGKTNKGISVSGSNLTMEHGPRAYLTSECTSSVGPSTFAKMLWNASKTLSYTVDLSKVGCGCNAALYLVAMPYHDKDACGDYYCDANFPHCHCPEMDIQEANTHAWQATPHKCSGTKGAYTSCDKGGCGKHFTGSDYGPGKTIDTTLPFEVSVTLQPTSVVKLRQGAHTASVHDPCAVNAEALRDGMVVAISNWGGAGGGMSWLDGQHCSPSTQCNNGAATWSDLRMCAAGHDFCE